MIEKIKQRLFYSIRKYVIKSIPEINILFGQGISFVKCYYNKDNCGENVKIYPPAHISSDTKIGNYTYISQNAYISNTSIGKCCSIGPNLICGWGIHPLDGISTAPMFYSTMKQNGMTLSSIDKINERKPITIGNDVLIGANVTILDGVTIGNGAVIGAGAVVSKDIPAYAIAVGCPIRIIRYRFPEEIRKKIQSTKWWDFSLEKLKSVEMYEFDVNGFISLFEQ